MLVGGWMADGGTLSPVMHNLLILNCKLEGALCDPEESGERIVLWRMK